jgi:DNA-binding transcriptional regulator LsrR (DeoR family)
MKDKSLSLRAAWYTYGAGLKQNQVADLLQKSRPKVNRMLTSARNSGFISYSVEGDPQLLLELEACFMQRYCLKSCFITRSPDSAENLSELGGEALIEAGVHQFQSLMLNLAIQTVGLGKGRTIRELSKRLSLPYSNDYTWVALQGCLGISHETNPFDIIEDLCGSLGGEGYLLPLAAIERSAQEAKRALQRHGISDVLNLAKSAKLKVLGVGAINNTPHLSEIFGLEIHEIARLKHAGAVGDILGNFIDKEGQIIVSADCPTALAIPLNELSSYRSLVIAGGLQKTDILRAALKGGYITDLVTDIESAEHILNSDPSEN